MIGVVERRDSGVDRLRILGKRRDRQSPIDEMDAEVTRQRAIIARLRYEPGGEKRGFGAHALCLSDARHGSEDFRRQTFLRKEGDLDRPILGRAALC